MSLKQKIKWKTVRNYRAFYVIKKIFVFVCMYKMTQISTEAYKKCETEIIGKGRYFWINIRDLEVESD